MQRFRHMAGGQGVTPARPVKQDTSGSHTSRTSVTVGPSLWRRRLQVHGFAGCLALGAVLGSACAAPDGRGVPFEVSVGSGGPGSGGGTTGEDDTTADAPAAESGDSTGSGGDDASTGGGPSTTDATSEVGTSENGSAEGGDGSTGMEAGPADGMMRVLSYNVAGLPDFISGSNPLVNTPLMSARLNEFDLVLVQEDFSYHAQLSVDADHLYQSMPGGGGTLGDGLNRFSRSAFEDFQRTGWTQCNGLVDAGSDCLTEKGFSVGLHELGAGAAVDVYNLHMDAGGSQADIAARQAQIQQMLGTISARSVDRAIIVAGDTNMDEEDEADFVTLLQGAGLTDACRELECDDEYRIDRIMFRSSAQVELRPTSWLVDLSFADANGEQLSDHEAVVVEFDWVKR